MNKPCPWYDMCIYKTATCKVRYPDEGCVLFRWFKELIKESRDTTTVTLSDCNEEWYCHTQICDSCGDEFMSPGAKFCPGCGKEIIGKETKNDRL